MRRLSLQFSFILIFLVILALITGASFSVLRNVYINQLQDQSRNIAENVEAFGTWVASYGRIWVKDNDESFLGHMSVVSASDNNSQAEFYSKNPALAQREFSEIVASLPVQAKFRMTSHNYMNPKNRPDNFEANALNIIRSENLDEYNQMQDGFYRYAKTVYHDASCISCHGDPENAPDDVKNQYGIKNGFGFKEGDVAGIISVTIPAQSLYQSAINFIGIKEILLILIAFLIPIIFVRNKIIKPIESLTDAADQISVGKQVDIGASKISEYSNNEIEKLTLATNRLGHTVSVAIKRIRFLQKPEKKPT